MKVLITGASGFIGSSLARRLEEESYDVYSLTRYVASDSRYDFYQLKKKIVCDVRSGDRIFDIFGEVKPDVVIHLAAMSSVSYSFLGLETAREVSEVIYMGTMNIAEACLKVGAYLIHASTSEFYGKQDKFPILETAIPYPLSPYAVAKVAAEEYIRYLARNESLNYTILRPYNTYNRSQVNKPYFVVERAITQALQEGKIHLYTPIPTRDLLDRDSHVDAYVKCVETIERGEGEKINGEAINVGRGQGITIGEMARMVAKIVTEETGKQVDISWDMQPDRPHDIQTLICSNKKAKALLGWEPLYSLEEGLRIAVREWKVVLGL